MLDLTIVSRFIPSIVHGTRMGLPVLRRFFHAFLGLDVSPIRMFSTVPGRSDAVSGDGGD